MWRDKQKDCAPASAPACIGEAERKWWEFGDGVVRAQVVFRKLATMELPHLVFLLAAELVFEALAQTADAAALARQARGRV